MTVEEALNQGKITIDLLDKYGVEYIKKDKNKSEGQILSEPKLLDKKFNNLGSLNYKQVSFLKYKV